MRNIKRDNMRIAFFSDIHSNVHALEAVLKHAQEQGVDRKYCLGDVVGYNANPAGCVRLVRENMDEVILGNHDWAVVLGEPKGFNPLAKEGVAYSRRSLTDEDADYLRSLSPEARHPLGGVDVETFHASPWDPLWEYVFPPDALGTYKELAGTRPDDVPRVIALGHTHVPMLCASHALPEGGFGEFPAGRVQDNLTHSRQHPLLLLNPGAVGQPRDGDPRAAYAILDTRDVSVTFHRVQYDVGAAARAVREAGLPDLLAERLFVGR